jgi:hypothetical protein
MTFIDRTNSSALRKKSRAVQENLHVQKFQRCKSFYSTLYYHSMQKANTSPFCMLGFLPGCDLLLSSEVEHRDYQKNINAKIFEKFSQH